MSTHTHRFVAALLALAAGTPAAATTWYTVQSLGTLPGDTHSLATGLNDHGDVVGWSSGPAGYRGFVWTADAGMQALAGVPDRPRADGGTDNHYAFTNGRGQARFETTGPAGTYRLQVVNIEKSLYTFNPKKSRLKGRVTVP
jgi:hypothetical protein